MTDASTRGDNAEAASETQTKQDIALAESVLRGKDIPAQEAYDLAERLRKVNEFGRARRLYWRIWIKADWPNLKVTAAKVGQRHALSTYKDPDLPAADRFQRALEILDEVDQLDLGAPPASLPPAKLETFDRRVKEIEQRQESLGLRGAVYKRRWQVEGQRIDLERALGFYLKGYQIGLQFEKNELGVETDQGYNGINAAFVLDLLAREDARQAMYADVESTVAIGRFTAAREIRRLLASKLPALVEREAFAWLRNEWWFHATIAEAHLGLGEFEQAVTQLRAFNVAHNLEHAGPPLERIARWEFESTLTQLAALAQLQVDLADLLANERGVSSAAKSLCETQWTERGRTALREYLGRLAPALDRAETGKVGLALSGGGFRASLFLPIVAGQSGRHVADGRRAGIRPRRRGRDDAGAPSRGLGTAPPDDSWAGIEKRGRRGAGVGVQAAPAGVRSDLPPARQYEAAAEAALVARRLTAAGGWHRRPMRTPPVRVSGLAGCVSCDPLRPAATVSSTRSIAPMLRRYGCRYLETAVRPARRTGWTESVPGTALPR
jgi:tetratricopeptide repeat protein